MNLNLMVFIHKNNLPKINDGAYVINLDEFKSIGTHWVALFVNDNNATDFDSLGVEHIPPKFRVHKNIITNIYIEYKHMIR